MGHTEDSAKPAKFVNQTCPIMGKTIKPDRVPEKLTRTFQGGNVAFCCGGCTARWDKMTDQQRAEKLQAAGATH